jgi:hypothetical protein
MKWEAFTWEKRYKKARRRITNIWSVYEGNAAPLN